MTRELPEPIAVIEQASPEVLPAGRAPGFSKLKHQSRSQVFTKSDNVKSRNSWTAERRQQLQEMWDCGEKAAMIAAALGCKVGAINVARARFGLKPRRTVSGRPKQIDDEPVHKIERVAFTTSRLMEFCTEKELVAQTGHESDKWPLVVVKELVDNGIDACEEAGIAPVIKVAIIKERSEPTRIVIEDNGPGIPAETVTGLIDYNVRISSREAYISPTRGRQGNALKTILPMAYVLGRENRGETWIEARGIKHCIMFSVNQIKQEPIVNNIKSQSRLKSGTSITVFWPSLIDIKEIKNLLVQFVWVNPHLSLQFAINGKTLIDHRATKADWTKYRACDATSAHWYTLEQFERYAGALIARDQEQRRATRQKYTVREFIAQFRGTSATEKQKQVLCELNVAHMTLHQFFGSETRVNHQRMEKLLKLLQKHTRPVRPEFLGVIGEEHLRRFVVGYGGEPQSFKYFVSTEHDKDGRPYVIEIATCPYKKWVAGKQETRHRQLITGVNFSATLENPFDTLRNMEGMEEILAELRAGSYAPIIVCVHYAFTAHRIFGSRQEPHWPGVNHRMGAADDIKKGLSKNLANFTKQRKAEERQAGAYRWRTSRMTEVRGEYQTEATNRFMPECYMKVSDNNQLPALARQLFYAIRKLVEGRTEKPLKYPYFSQTLLPDYIKTHPDETRDWDVVYDDRGHFVEPHTGRMIGIGTLNVRNYLQKIRSLRLDTASFSAASVNTYGPDGCYGAVLYVEKEGFMPLFERINLAKRYDIAVMSSKGMSVTAARELVNRICSNKGIPLFVLHDFDGSGIIIKDTLENDTRRFSYTNAPNVIDLGLSHSDIDGLDPEEYNCKISRERLEQAGIADEAVDFSDGPTGRVERHDFAAASRFRRR